MKRFSSSCWQMITLAGLLALILLAGCSASPATLPAPAPSRTGMPSSTPTQKPTTVISTTPQKPRATWRPSTRTPTITATASLLPPEPAALENTPVPIPLSTISTDNAHQVAPLARWGKGSIQDIAYSPDGKQIGVATSLGVYLYDSQTLEQVSYYPSTAPVGAIAFSPDLQSFAWGLSTGEIEIRNVPSGQLLPSLPGQEAGVIELAYINNGENLVSIYDEWHNQDSYRLNWDLSTGQPIGGKGIINQSPFQLAEEGRTLAVDATTATLRQIDAYNVRTWQRSVIGEYNSYLYFMEMSPDGQYLLVEDVRQITIWRVDQPEAKLPITNVPEYSRPFFAYTCQREADGPGFSAVESAAFSPDSQTLVLAARSGMIQIRSVSDGAIRTAFPGHASQIIFSPDGSTFVLRSSDGVIEVRKTADGTLLKQLTGHSTAFTSVSFSPDGRFLAAGATDPLVRIWRLPDGERALNLQTQANQVAFSPDGAVLATGSDLGGVVLWNTTTGERWQLESGGKTDFIYSILALQFTQDGKTLLAGSRDCQLKGWDTGSGQQTISYINSREDDSYFSNEEVFTLAPSPDGQYVAINQFESILFFNLQDRRQSENLPLDSNWPREIAYAPNGEWFAFGGEFQVWQTSPRRKMYTVNGSVNNLVISFDGKLLATSDGIGTIYLWNAADGQLLAELRGHRAEINQLTFSRDGKYLASAAKDGTVRVWGIP